MKTKGIHHITAIASDPQKTYDFYTQVLGFRLVKKTVNQDDPGTYHLFFGDKIGSPGIDLTFFTFQPAIPGRHGTGLVTTISLAVPDNSLEFWQKRLEEKKVQSNPINKKFGKRTLALTDQDGQRLELVGIPEDELPQSDTVWTTNDITEDVAIRNFHAATLCVTNKAQIEPALLVLGYEFVKKEQHVHLYQLKNSKKAAYLEIDESPLQETGVNTTGTVHHIAFRAKNEEEQQVLREKVIESGLYPTSVIDRFYFKSVYFRTPAGILFEIATEGPGFTTDESEEELGKKLALPPFLENMRDAIEKNLPKIIHK